MVCMGNSPAYHDETVLRELYWDEDMTLQEIGDKFGVDKTTIRDWMVKHGIERRYSGTLRERFDQYHVKDANEEGCWLWQNEPDDWGYGTIWDSDKGGHRKAHRVAIELYDDRELPPFSPEQQVNHTCHNTLCVNPDHLYIGTAEDNTQDALEAEAWGDDRPRGSDVGTSKLTEEQVVEIKERCLSGESQKAVSEDYPVSHATVNKIMTSQRWQSVGPDVSDYDNAPDVQRGRTNNRSKLTEEQVREIRRRYENGENSKELAEDMPVGSTAIMNIVNQNTWQHVE